MTDARLKEFAMLNEWAKLKYYDPEKILLEIRRSAPPLLASISHPKVRELRTNKLKWAKEAWEAAIFCYGLQNAVLKVPVQYARHEAADYDIVVRWIENETQCYAPLQLKEVVPAHINPAANLEAEIVKLQKYVSSDLIVAMRVNQRISRNFSDIKIPPLKIRELWIYGCISENSYRWCLWGDLLKMGTQFSAFDFEYPGGPPRNGNTIKGLGA
jgi:hypothetical protein